MDGREDGWSVREVADPGEAAILANTPVHLIQEPAIGRRIVHWSTLPNRYARQGIGNHTGSFPRQSSSWEAWLLGVFSIATCVEVDGYDEVRVVVERPQQHQFYWRSTSQDCPFMVSVFVELCRKLCSGEIDHDHEDGLVSRLARSHMIGGGRKARSRRPWRSCMRNHRTKPEARSTKPYELRHCLCNDEV
jgi:hypothetical protein